MLFFSQGNTITYQDFGLQNGVFCIIYIRLDYYWNTWHCTMNSVFTRMHSCNLSEFNVGKYQMVVCFGLSLLLQFPIVVFPCILYMTRYVHNLVKA